MKVRMGKRTIPILWAFLITVSGSIFCNQKGVTSYIEYLAYGLLLVNIILCYVKKRNKVKLVPIAVFFLFCIGIIVQDLSLYRRAVLCFTMLALWIVIYLAEGYLDSVATMRSVSYAVFFGILVSAILSAITGYPLTDKLENNISSWGFNGGILYKNYFAADVIVIFIGIHLYRRYVRKTQIDFLIQLIAIVFLFISFSKGAWIMLLVFMVIMDDKVIKHIKRGQRKYFIGILAVLFIVSFKVVALHSETYLYRIRGFSNYISYYREDMFHMIFGSAERVYDKAHSYGYMVRSTTGWDGSLEFAWLNILIKNGILGIIGFGVIILHFLKASVEIDSLDDKAVYLAIFIMLFTSSLVEIYIQSIHNILGVYCFMILSTFINKKTNTKQRCTGHTILQKGTQM